MRDGRLRFILAVAGTASLSSMLDALGQDARLPKMVELLDPGARTAAVKALTDKTNNVVGTSTGEASTSEQTSGPAGAGYSGGSDTDSDYDDTQEIAVWDARRTLLAGDPPPTVTAATGTG